MWHICESIGIFIGDRWFDPHLVHYAVVKVLLAVVCGDSSKHAMFGGIAINGESDILTTIYMEMNNHTLNSTWLRSVTMDLVISTSKLLAHNGVNRGVNPHRFNLILFVSPMWPIPG